MRIKFASVLLLVTGLPATAASVEISGFIDYRYDDAENAQGQFQFRPGNGVELSLAAQITPSVAAQATVVSGGGGITLGPSYVDINFVNHVPHSAHGEIVDHSGVKIGLFDAPFGIEARYYSSVERPTISAPFLTSRMLGGGWTDWGMHLHFARGGAEHSPARLALDLFAVTGLQWQDGTDGVFGTFDDGLVTVPLTAFANGKTIGGRIGWMPMEGLEVGASVAAGEYRANIGSLQPGMTLAGMDLTYERGPFRIRGEYAAFSGEQPPPNPDFDARTWYLEGGYQVTERFTAVARYDEIQFDFDRDGDALRNDGLRAWLVGGKYAISDHVALRAEIQKYLYQRPRTSFSAPKDDAVRASVVADF